MRLNYDAKRKEKSGIPQRWMWRVFEISEYEKIVGFSVIDMSHASSPRGRSSIHLTHGILATSTDICVSDGFARDVTARYARNYGAHVARARARVAAGGKHGKTEWWDSVMRILQRPYALVSIAYVPILKNTYIDSLASRRC